MRNAIVLLVVAVLAGPAFLVDDSRAGEFPDVSGLCGEGYNAVVLCGLREALCVPEGCTDFGAVSCCPPTCDGDDGNCEGPDQNAPECQGSAASCGPGCECFVVSIHGTMAPLLGRTPLAILLVSLFAGGLWLARARTSSRP